MCSRLDLANLYHLASDSISAKLAYTGEADLWYSVMDTIFTQEGKADYKKAAYTWLKLQQDRLPVVKRARSHLYDSEYVRLRLPALFRYGMVWKGNRFKITDTYNFWMAEEQYFAEGEPADFHPFFRPVFNNSMHRLTYDGPTEAPATALRQYFPFYLYAFEVELYGA
jgi:hypothetical protein